MATASNLAPFYRGDTKSFNLTFRDANGDPIDLSGHELWFTMKREIGDADDAAVLQKRIVFLPNAESAAGNGVLILDSSETSAIDPGTYYFDMQKVIPENPPLVTTLMSGRVSVLPDVTQRVS
ncbi:hypothetical protein [Magnetofaba australis]|uniref:Putative long tail fiber protein n=1 Tax=Magnetofaba australis IT-1 TaxID=1434232 RepID=A0A1Y2K9M8_9PROT|nr:hypothetical protein [Magnetofaba australis]OSM07661.1 putative long tail fiber protein [Magnetofaba australis IT-1]